MPCEEEELWPETTETVEEEKEDPVAQIKFWKKKYLRYVNRVAKTMSGIYFDGT